MIAACNCALVLDAKVKPFSPSQSFADENSPGDLAAVVDCSCWKTKHWSDLCVALCLMIKLTTQ